MNVLFSQIKIVLNPLVQTKVESFQKVIIQMARIGDALAIPPVDATEMPHVNNNNVDRQGNVNLGIHNNIDNFDLNPNKILLKLYTIVTLCFPNEQ